MDARHDHDDGHDHAHDHAHGLGHSHVPHVHGGDPGPVLRALRGALVVAALFMVAEIAGGIAGHSLALLGDAAHMFTDCAAYGIALYAAWVARRPPTPQRTWGYARVEILAALLNGATLIAASGWIVYEAVRRLAHPAAVESGLVIWIALAGLVANLAIIAMLVRVDDGTRMNVRGALLHGIADAASSVVVVASGAIIALTGFDRADAIASLVIAVLVLRGSIALVREAADVLLETAPADLHAPDIAAAMLDVDDVNEVHDLHVWSVTPGHPALSAHVRVTASADRDTVLRQLQELLASRFAIEHSTLQVAGDRGAAPIETVTSMAPADAVEWATDHIAATHPHLARSVIAAATGAAALGCAADERISPVAVSVRALAILRRSSGDQA